MYVSSVIICDCLKEFSPTAAGKKSLRKKKYMGAQIPLSAEDILPEHFLVVPVSFTKDNPQLVNGCFICAGTPEETFLENNYCICLLEDVSLQQVIYKIQKTFWLLNNWEKELRRELKNNGSLKRICERSISVFHKPIFVHDQNNELLISVNAHERQFKWQYDKQTKKYCLPREILNHFKVSEEYHHTMKTTGADMFSAEEFGYRILYINLRIELHYVGRICICELGDEIRDGDYELIEFLAEIIIAALQQGNLLVSNPGSALGAMFHSLLAGEKLSEKEISGTLDRNGWKADDPYFCVCVFFRSEDYTINTMTYLTNRLLNIFYDCCVFLEKNKAVIVVNRNVYAGSYEDFLVSLSLFLGDDLLSAGISKTGNNFHDFRYYIRQAEIAYQMGHRTGDSSNVFFFEHYIFPYCLNSMTKELRPEMMLDEHLEALIAYDAQHNTEFAKTLCSYLQNERNVKMTTFDMDVHRSTMNYRIERIRQLLGMDLDDPQVRLKLLLSFELLKHEEEGG